MAEKNYYFDHVSLSMPGGGYNLITKEEFMKIPLKERMNLVLNGRAEFIYQGQIVSLKKAFGKE